MKENRRITDGGELGEAIWKEIDNAVDQGMDLKAFLDSRNLHPDIIAKIIANYPNIPKR